MGNEFLVNTYITGYQSRSDVTALLDGGYVITWRSYQQDGNASGIYAQRYDVNGIKVGNEFLVNTVTESTQSFPSITALTDGGYVITWHSNIKMDLITVFMASVMMSMAKHWLLVRLIHTH